MEIHVNIKQKSFNQVYRQDYNETFAPVALIATFRTLMPFAIQHNLLIHFFKGHAERGHLYEHAIRYRSARSTMEIGLKQSARC